MVIALLLYVALPITGITLFLILVRKMIKEKVPKPPIIPLFIAFACYGTLLVLMATHLFWYWSGMASLGLLFQLIIAPILMLWVAVESSRNAGISKYHLWIFRMAWLYFVVLLVLTLILYS